MSRATSEARSTSGPLVVFKLQSPAKMVTAEIRSAAARRAFSAEVLGTVLLTFFTLGAVIVTGGMLGERLSSSRLLVTSLAHGVAFGLLAFTMAGQSGGHLNPVLTVGAVITRQLSPVRGVTYLVAQLLGCVAGALLLKLSLPVGVGLALGVPTLGARVTPESALVVEGVLAFTLTIAFLASTGRALGPVVLGLTTALGRLFATALTGAPMNPALVFGISLTSGVWSWHWVWWVGPMLGSALAAVCWRSWLSKGADGGRSGADGGARAWR
jgi:glycerol uptake facilitator-like aquaporin